MSVLQSTPSLLKYGTKDQTENAFNNRATRKMVYVPLHVDLRIGILTLKLFYDK